MDVKVFKTFLEVAQTRHFGRAAENLYITQAATSARIKQLESYFDTRLFIRDRNNIKLTSAGERLIAYAEVMVSTLEQAKNELALGDNKTLQLSLAGTPNIWDAYLQSSLSQITSAFSGYGFQAEALSRAQLNRNLLERTLDIAFSFDPLKSDELMSKEIARMTLALVSTQRSDVTSALSNQYVYIDWGTRFASEHALRHQQMPAPYLRTSTGRIALDFILDKTGAAYLPVSMVSPLLASTQLYSVEGAELWLRPIFINYRKDSVSFEAIAKIEGLLQEMFPQL
ncbi:LysR family transcriptional regulator [Shewanella benthica]|uniref:LysR family transcriptional regulator n=1 Tax=Shewanella benthica TaxID=43661 RepID=UPI0018793942|nr:LysR family transcriptional regulator [Shewanella benthica]MBE7216599.1 LysR family transcriptional regulator [Shewanella benthica]MCL1064726.1 LysR family transcriptional regulator [Shewanella benthica]